MLDGVKKLVSSGSGIGRRAEALEAVVEAARGRLDDTLLDEAHQVADRVSERLRLSAHHTVVGLAGATGSGKSSTFNALTGLELSAVGVRRPTTSWATACVWGGEGAGELLTWLGIPPRHHVTRDSMLDSTKQDDAFDGVVLLDLPDHDSTDVSHHLEADRLVQLADVLVWVLDPQKYADAAIHNRYLKPMASHANVMIVVLNHIDTVPEDRREQMLSDVRRLLAADGLDDVPVFAVSARHGDNMEKLRKEIAKRVASKKATRKRLEADVKAVGEKVSAVSGTAAPKALGGDVAGELDDALADAAGVPVVVDAVEASARMRAARATGWPVVAWVSKLKPDPLKRLHLDLGQEGRALVKSARTSIPEPTPVQSARVDAAVRAACDEVGEGLAKPWQQAIRGAATARLGDLNDRLDHTLASTDLGVARVPWWASLVRIVQWLLILAVLAGGVWLAGLALAGSLQFDVPSPKVGPVAVPTLLLVGGVAGGILLALLSRVLVNLSARSKARAADRRLREGIHAVAQDLVLSPINTELAAYAVVREQLARVLKK
ncbi:YfjP family GTPase [Nocardioides jiangxiensis]|uniref:YfjP family GTPase n=1 Tax=Nocardioides jiangxiensis TaxID=3064524 RepID=A0ABT9B3S0_9ACTN|nr:YfjP family GTPase [Nocardioides sp. WY-20]MDO7869025.1 YfjP family GTPase [Nocardioides sp. WY-20]